MDNIGIISTNNSAVWFGEISTTKVPIPSYSGSMTYNGSEQTAHFDNYDDTLMTVTGNKGTNAGEYTAIFTLKDTIITEWSDGTTTPKNVVWTIEYSISVPNANDPNVKVANIEQFVEDNRDTSLQVGFQSDGNGKFYAKATTYGEYIIDSDPKIKDTGVLIYDSGVANMNNDTANYICAAHLGNVINYILYITKGSNYGSSNVLFSDTPQNSQFYSTSLTSSQMQNGISGASNGTIYYFCSTRNSTGYYNGQILKSSDTFAVWF